MVSRRSRFSVGPRLAFVIAGISFSFGLLVKPLPTAPLKFQLSYAAPPPPLRLVDCLPPTSEEKAMVHAAVDALQFPWKVSGFFSIGAMRFLSSSNRRGAWSPEAPFVCDEPEEYARAARLLDQTGDLQSGRRDQYELTFISRMRAVNAGIAASVADVAFNDSAQSDDLYEDYRPFARSVLASLGSLAEPYTARAFASMGSADALQTGSAQIAVAGHYPGALSAVEQLMTNRLASLPANIAISLHDEYRLDELAYALAFGGTEARSHIAPLRAYMLRKVHIPVSPTVGTIDGPPRRMCDVLSQITGIDKPDLGYAYCK